LIVPISRVDAGIIRTTKSVDEVRGILVQNNREVADLYQVTATPAAVLVKNGKIAGALVAGGDPIRGLVTNTVATRVRPGETVPAIRLAGLDGETIDISTLSGRRTLLLFWDPACGYCQEMLGDVKRWERQRPNGAPALVVIAAGSPDSNRQQGFMSPVLLDGNFSAGHAFGVHGTPSAVLLDENGRVASDVRVGANEVMALAGGTFH
jgi:thioredoxin-related protein